MLDLSPGSLDTVKAILKKHVPNAEVRAFGSRVMQTAKPYSDLDLAIVAEKKLDIKVLGRLREDFQESDLPIRVDIVDWHAISKEFKSVITTRYEVIQKS